jgi:hypothetical protein
VEERERSLASSKSSLTVRRGRGESGEGVAVLGMSTGKQKAKQQGFLRSINTARNGWDPSSTSLDAKGSGDPFGWEECVRRTVGAQCIVRSPGRLEGHDERVGDEGSERKEGEERGCSGGCPLLIGTCA